MPCVEGWISSLSDTRVRLRWSVTTWLVITGGPHTVQCRRDDYDDDVGGLGSVVVGSRRAVSTSGRARVEKTDKAAARIKFACTADAVYEVGDL